MTFYEYFNPDIEADDEHCAPEGAPPAATPQPAPVRGGRSCTILVVADLMTFDGIATEVRDAVIVDLIARDEMGFNKYGQNLEVGDGRDTLIDWYQEMLDAAQYGRKFLEEHPNDDDAKIQYLETLKICMHLRLITGTRKNPPWIEVETQDEPIIDDDGRVWESGIDHNAVTSFVCSACGMVVVGSKTCPCRLGGAK